MFEFTSTFPQGASTSKVDANWVLKEYFTLTRFHPSGSVTVIEKKYC
jgi:hypothetical protein